MVRRRRDFNCERPVLRLPECGGAIGITKAPARHEQHNRPVLGVLDSSIAISLCPTRASCGCARWPAKTVVASSFGFSCLAAQNAGLAFGQIRHHVSISRSVFLRGRITGVWYSTSLNLRDPDPFGEDVIQKISPSFSALPHLLSLSVLSSVLSRSTQHSPSSNYRTDRNHGEISRCCGCLLRLGVGFHAAYAAGTRAWCSAGRGELFLCSEKRCQQHCMFVRLASLPRFSSRLQCLKGTAGDSCALLRGIGIVFRLCVRRRTSELSRETWHKQQPKTGLSVVVRRGTYVHVVARELHALMSSSNRPLKLAR